MTGLGPSLVLVAAILAAAAVAGRAAAAALFAPRDAGPGERAGWGLLLGLAAIAAAEAAELSVGLAPGRVAPVLALLLLAAAGHVLRLPAAEPTAPPEASRRLAPSELLLAAVAAAGVLLYLLRALTEPMWSNDFLAIWGLKGRAIFGAGFLPRWLSDPAMAGWSHPEYPLGLPLLYAGLASLLGRWDDHAMALVDPALCIATLAILFGWLVRRGVSRRTALAASALVALCEPLYSAFLTGMAEVPVAAAVLALGTALSDAIDAMDRGAERRLAVASLLAASIKNEGLFLAAAAALLALAARRGGPRRWRTALLALVPALAARLATRLGMGAAPLRDFDFGLLAPSRAGELVSRLGQALRSAASIAAPAWIALLAVAVLVALGRRVPSADRLLVLAAIGLAAYVLLPALAVLGPDWLARSSLARTAAALAPLVAAGIAGRFAPVTGEG